MPSPKAPRLNLVRLRAPRLNPVQPKAPRLNPVQPRAPVLPERSASKSAARDVTSALKTGVMHRTFVYSSETNGATWCESKSENAWTRVTNARMLGAIGGSSVSRIGLIVDNGVQTSAPPHNGEGYQIW